MTREETAVAFAGAIGWDVIRDTSGQFSGWGVPPSEVVTQEGWIRQYVRWPSKVSLPAPDAPLSSHLAFVGHVVEALEAMEGDGHTYLIECGRVFDGWTPVGYRVGIYYRSGDDNKSEAPDPSWAAMLAAIAARKRK